MHTSDLIVSIAFHAAVIGAAAWAYRLPEPNAEDETLPAEMFFEVVEAAPPEQPEVPEQPEASEQPEVPEPQEVQEVPQVPDVPDVPEVPDNPEIPEIPDNPEPPEAPEPPETPEPPPPPEPSEAPETPSLPLPVADQEQAQVMSAPRALNKILPRYPRSARRKGHEGSVTVEVEVNESGEVSASGVVSSSGHRELDDAALDAVETIRFAPATKDGLNVGGRIRLTFEFKLQETR